MLEKEQLDEKFKADHTDGAAGTSEVPDDEEQKAKATPPGKTPPQKGEKEKKKLETKAGMTSKVIDGIKEMSVAELQRLMSIIEGKDMEDDKENDDDEDKEDKDDDDDVNIEIKNEKKKVTKEDLDISDAFDSLFEGHELSEDFKTQAKVIFETVLVEKLNKVLEKMVSDEADLKAQIVEDISSKLDRYLDYATEEYMTENELAIENGLKVQLMEDFMLGLKGLFEESYIEIPEDKSDLVGTLSDKVDDLTESLNREIIKNITITEEIEGYRRAKTIDQNSEGLTSVEAEKLNELCEHLVFDNEHPEEFDTKVKVIKEKYFGKKAKSEGTGDVPTSEDNVLTESNNPLMDVYFNTISKSIRK